MDGLAVQFWILDILAFIGIVGILLLLFMMWRALDRQNRLLNQQNKFITQVYVNDQGMGYDQKSMESAMKAMRMGIGDSTKRRAIGSGSNGTVGMDELDHID